MFWDAYGETIPYSGSGWRKVEIELAKNGAKNLTATWLFSAIIAGSAEMNVMSARFTLRGIKTMSFETRDYLNYDRLLFSSGGLLATGDHLNLLLVVAHTEERWLFTFEEINILECEPL